ncbi:MAG: exodeoxyribonuclease VII large subunit [Deltaproteobacteria bacterium]|nr:exodeoxyribonuclease VII large subunit [Deltaproteobacteria bacterium]
MNKTECLSVNQLVNLIQEIVETNFVAVTVEGEVSNFAKPASGHWYFTLKDSKAQIRAVMFHSHNRMIGPVLENGMRVICSGSVSVYSARGEMQLVIDNLVPAGRGDLQLAFERLKEKLALEGLFDESRKKLIPDFPLCVGVVTSPTGAAFQDILNVLKRRVPGIKVLLRPVKVQGSGSKEDIAQAILDLNSHGCADVIIIGRGGGSLEDLWAFNEEIVARAISGSLVPVVSGVGHEVDYTIADFVSDLRAPTPSAAAELVAKSRVETETHLDHLIIRLQAQVKQSLQFLRQGLEQLERRLGLATRNLTDRDRNVDEKVLQLKLSMQMHLHNADERLAQFAARMDVLSPLKQMARGYVIASREKCGQSLGSIIGLGPREKLWIRFYDGQARTTIEEIEDA